MTEIVTDTFVRDDELLARLEPTAQLLYDRHIGISDKNLWLPDAYVPWSYAQDYDPQNPWKKEDLPVSQGLVSALEVNLLTEDNLPYYFGDLNEMFGSLGIWGTWARRWTAEEGRHSIVLRNGLFATRLVDPVQLESDRMIQVSGGEVPHPATTLDGFIYVALQELATRISHKNTAKELTRQSLLIHDVDTKAAIGKFVTGIDRTSIDENLHYLFYKDISQKALELDPLQFFESLARVIRYFKMPGTGIRDFKGRSAEIASTGIYNATVHSEKIVKHVLLNQWHVDIFSEWGTRSATEVHEIEDARANVMKQIRLVERAAKFSEATSKPVTVS